MPTKVVVLKLTREAFCLSLKGEACFPSFKSAACIIFYMGLIFCILFDQAKSVKGFADVKAKILGIKKHVSLNLN